MKVQKTITVQCEQKQAAQITAVVTGYYADWFRTGKYFLCQCLSGLHVGVCSLATFKTKRHTDLKFFITLGAAPK